jgi:hypothetical protein
MNANVMKTGSLAVMLVLALAAVAQAADAETSAEATSGRFGRPGTASGTARYVGDIGFARTDSRSGAVNSSRSVAVGVDENGLAVSMSTAIASQHGPAIGVQFSTAIGRDGRVSRSASRSIAQGGVQRGVAVGGRVSTLPASPSHGRAIARTVGGGIGRAVSDSRVGPDGRLYSASPVLRVGEAPAASSVHRESVRVVKKKVVRRVVKRVYRR